MSVVEISRRVEVKGGRGYEVGDATVLRIKVKVLVVVILPKAPIFYSKKKLELAEIHE